MRVTALARTMAVVLIIVALPYVLGAQTGPRLQGRVKEVLPQRGAGDGHGTHMVVATRTGLVEVCLGPTRFLETNHGLPRIGDVVVVRGHPVTSTNGELFLASSVASGGRTVTLRSSAGKPRWPGCGHDCGRAGNCDQHHPEHHEHDSHH